MQQWIPLYERFRRFHSICHCYKDHYISPPRPTPLPHHLQRLLNHFSSPPHRPRSPIVLLLVLFLWRPTTVCSNLYAKTTHTSEMKPIGVACNNTLQP